MKKVFKILGGIVVVVALIGVVALYKTSENKTESTNNKPTVKIGVTLPLTGNMTETGNSIKEAIMIAAEEIPADSKYEYKIFLEDDAFNPKTILSNARNFTDVQGVDAIISIFSSPFRIIAPIAEATKTPNLTVSFGKDLLKGYPYSFNNCSSPETQSEAFFDMLKNRGYTNFSIIAVNIPSMQELLPQLRQDAIKNGIPLVSETVVNPGTKDFRMDIEKIKRTNPDILGVILLSPEIDIFAKQAKEQGLKTPLTSIEEINASKDKYAYEGSIYLTSPLGSPEFLAKLNSRIKQEAVTGIPAKMYDWVKIIVHLYETADHKLSKEELRDALSNLKDYQSVTGIPVSVKDNMIDTPLVEVKIENGQIKAVQ